MMVVKTKSFLRINLQLQTCPLVYSTAWGNNGCVIPRCSRNPISLCIVARYTFSSINTETLSDVLVCLVVSVSQSPGDPISANQNLSNLGTPPRQRSANQRA